MTLRPIDRRRDRAAVSALDTSFETDTIFDVVVAPRSIALVERAVAPPHVKRYSMGEAFAEWSTWDTGWVAEDDGTIVGVAAVEHEAWHARLVLWHLYVARAHRKRGLARALLAEVEAHGRSVGARTVWLETTSANVPGVHAYERLGYALCGADVTVYDTLPYADECALYLAKRL
jgi:GNAT superfamily N-acetyltransferase